MARVVARPSCDACGRESLSVHSCGRDANGEADAPDLCFVCRKAAEQGKVWDRKQHKYVKVEGF